MIMLGATLYHPCIVPVSSLYHPCIIPVSSLYHPSVSSHCCPQKLLAAVNASVSCSVGFNALGFIRPTSEKACKMIVVSEWVLCDGEGGG